ncbi:MAG: PAS domain S-box protein [Planctomycetales bacterium]|nr:PAS domain S-box protein [bacterium]UNM07180.1 MAG: PAS domain S-box protein [Planctomycetales bacterium]
MEGKLPAENREKHGASEAVQLHAESRQQPGRASVSADLRRLAAKLASLNPGQSGNTDLSGPFINLPEDIHALIHWVDPSPEFMALADPGESGLSVHQAVLSLLGRCSVDIETRLLEFLRQPGSSMQFECELDRGQRGSRVLHASLQSQSGNDQPLSSVRLSFSQPAGYTAPPSSDPALSPTLQCFFDNSREGMVLLDTRDRQTIITANPAFCGMLGLSLMGIEGRSISSLQPGGILQDSRSWRSGGLPALPASAEQELEFVSASGELVSVSARQLEIRDASGHIIGLALLTTDITEARRTASSIERSETRLAIGEELAGMGSWEYEAGQDQIILTDELSRIFGLSPSEPVAISSLLRHVMPRDRSQLLRQYRSALQDRKELSCDIRILTSTGRQRILRVRGRMMPGPASVPRRLVGMAQDVTERERAERIQALLLEISEATSRTASLEELLATVHRALGSLVPASNFYVSLYNPQTELYEFPFHIDELDEDFQPQPMDGSLTDIVRREGRPMVVNRDEQQKMRTQGLIRPHGPLSMSWLGVPLSDGENVNGVIVLQDYRTYAVYSQQDVELVSYLSGYIALAIQRRISSDRLRESEWQYRGLVDTMFEGLSMADPDGNFVYANPALGRIMGLHPEHLVGRNIREFLSGEMIKVADRQHDLRRGGSSNRYELRIQRADGQVRDLYLSVSPRYNSTGDFIGSHALVQDVTEMRQAEEAIRDNERRYRTLVEQMSEGLATVDASGVFEFANPALERILGLAEGSASGRSMYEFMDEQERQRINGQQELRRQGQSNSYTMRIRPLSGPVRIALVTASPRFSQDGEYIGSLALVRDVTEQMRTEEVLRESEEKYRTLVNDISEGIFVVDGENRFRFANPALERIMGVERGGLDGRAITEFLDDDQVSVVNRQDRLRQAGMGSSYRLRITRSDDEQRICLISSNPNTASDGSFLGSSGIVQDITEQERTLELLRANEEKFRHFYHNAPVMMYSIDSEGFIIDVNQKWLDETGYSREEVIGHRGDFLMTPESVQSMREVVDPQFQRVGRIHDIPFTYICSDGTLIDVLLDCEMSIDPSGHGVSLAIVRNVTEQNAAENQLRQVVIAVESAHEAIMTTDSRGVITYVNPAFEAITGYSRQEAIGSTPRLLSSGEMEEQFHREMWQQISRGEVWHGTFINRRKDGSIYQEEATISPVRDSRGELAGYVAVKRDVTRQLAMEEQLKQSQKMEAIGTLAGGIAHDFNNILFAIVGNAEIAMDCLPQHSSAGNYLQAIIDASSRAAELVRQVLSYARKKESSQNPLRVDLLVREVLKLLRASLPATVEIVQRLEAANSTVLANATEVHQLLMNLCTNAGHAMMEQGGTLTVSLTEFLPDDDFLMQHSGTQLRPYLRLDVEDTGDGIAEEHISRIFEPFFTTKEVGMGTGMGLSVVHGIVHSLQGVIEVRSRPAHWTRFSVYLPLCETESQSGESLEKAQRSGRGRVLLVDDEAMIIEIVSEMLTVLGYEVTSCQGGPQAWRCFSADPDAFDLVLTDQTMPQMTGEELSRRILELRPGIPVVMCTGYSQTLAPERARDIGITEYLHKPLKLKELGDVLQQVLEQAGSGD